MNYNPNISVKENALNNGVSEAAVRKYIKVHRIDRRYDQNLRKYMPIKKAMEEHPDWSARAIARELGIAPATVCHYKNKGISKREGKISIREAYRCLDFDTNTPIDFLRMEEYDGSKVGIVAFSKGTFKYNGNSVGFGNMRRFPIDFFGHRFDCPETAYIACCYGLNNPDCIRIQKEIQTSTNGLKCKRQYRYNETDRKFGRKDFHQSEWHFNLMLYLVWHKCLKYPDFGKMLLAIPDNVAIIENQNGFKKVKVGDWGCKNPEAKEAYNKRLAELKGSGKATEKMRETAIIDTWNAGKWTGCNHQGKILMACRTALRNGTEPCINYQALNDAEIYLFGEQLAFSIDARDISTSPKPKRTNSNLHKARAAKNDEYYTPLNEITKELRHYKKHFQGKTILCNCDSPDTSNFVKYFVENFSKLGLRKLVAVAFSATEKGSLYVYDGNEGRTISMKGNGDFRSEESIKHLSEADIVVTNPPFSLFKEYVKQLLDYGKQFLVIGNKNATTYNDIMTAIKANKLWSGYRSFNGDMWFDTPNGETINVPGCWFTNLDHPKRHKRIELTKYYNENEYPKYDNCDAIEVGKVKDIPCDYSDVMGVPLTFINHYCPEQFEIVGFLYGDDGKHLHLNGKELYFRMLIKLKKNRTNRKSAKMSISAE